MWRPLLLTLVGFLTACSPVYSKPGMTQAEFDRDAYACQRDALSIPPTPQSMIPGAYGQPVYSDPSLGWFHTAAAVRLLDACMRARGYVRE